MAFANAALILGASLVVLNLAFVGITAAVGLAMRLRLEEINIHAGPHLGRFSLGGAKVTVKLLPIGSGVRFAERDDSPEDAENRAVFLADLSPLCRVLFALSGPIGFFLLAAILLGANGGQHLATALPQVYGGAIKPTTLGVELLGSYVAQWRRSPATALGILSAKYAIYMLVPTIGSPGFTASTNLLKAVFGYELPDSLPLLPSLALLGPPLVVIVGWGVAFSAFLYPLLDAAI